MTLALDLRLAVRVLVCAAIGVSALWLAVQEGRTAATASASLCRAAEAHDARYAAAKLRFYRAWRGSPTTGANWERGAVVAGEMARIARAAIEAAESAGVETRDGQRLQAKLLRVHRAQRDAAVLYVDAVLLAGSGGPTQRIRTQRSIRAGRPSWRRTPCSSGQASSASSAEPRRRSRGCQPALCQSPIRLHSPSVKYEVTPISPTRIGSPSDAPPLVGRQATPS